MKVYVEEKEIPDHCSKCTFVNSGDECILQDEDANFAASDDWDSLRQGCPLIPIRKSECFETAFLQLAKCFPRSFMNGQGEFIAHAAANQYFILRGCENMLDVQCKVLEWLSRGAYKTEPFEMDSKNEKFHKFMRDGINKFLGTNFSEDDMEIIYTKLGNRCNHSLTVAFVNGNFDMKILTEGG